MSHFKFEGVLTQRLRGQFLITTEDGKPAGIIIVNKTTEDQFAIWYFGPKEVVSYGPRRKFDSWEELHEFLNLNFIIH